MTSGQVVALVGTVFRVTGNLGSARAGDEFRVTGVSMSVQSVNPQNNTVTVVQLVDIPFELVDDDTATHPFNVDTGLMQDSDSSSSNLFAPAYIRPIYDLGSGSRNPNFDLNLDNVELRGQLSAGRDYSSSDGFWYVYVQGGFQSSTLVDFDPNGSSATAGLTPVPERNGSVVFVEVLADFVASQNPAINLLAKTTTHEVGHQCFLDDNTGGITRVLPIHAAFGCCKSLI